MYMHVGLSISIWVCTCMYMGVGISIWACVCIDVAYVYEYIGVEMPVCMRLICMCVAISKAMLKEQVDFNKK